MDPDLINAINRLSSVVERDIASRSMATGGAGFNPTAAAQAGRQAASSTGQKFITEEITRAGGAAANAAASGFSNLASAMGNIPGIGGVISSMMTSLGDIFQELGGHAGAFGDMLGTTFSLLAQSFNSVFNVGKGLVNLVFAPLDALFATANAGGGSNEYRTQIEQIRKAFGDLRQGVGGQVYQAVKNVHGALAETGLSVYRIFGNRGQVAQAVRETAEALGNTISQLGTQLEEQAEHVITYRKVFDLSNESMNALGVRAITTGTTLEEQGRQISQVSLGLANRFGASARQIGRDVGEMIADVKNFGGIAPQVLGNISAHLRQLGLSYKSIVGVVEGFDNFETAAKNSATLAQQFGIQVDALQMMREQDPAARFETLRKQFFATGQSVETMSRQQIAALQAATNMDESAIRLGFSLKNQSKSYEDVQKQSEASQKKQLSQAEAMQELSHSIDRMVQSGQQMKNGFFEIFFDGFTKGVMRSREFRLIMMEVRQVMRIVFYEGIRVGRDFVKYFPGVADVFKGLQDIFNPSRWRSMMDSVRGLLKNFFKTVIVNPEAAGQNFITGIQNIFSKFFSGSSGGFRKVLEGAGNFIKALVFGMLGILKASIVEVQKTLAEMFTPGQQNRPGMIQQILSTVTEVWNTLKKALLDTFGKGSQGSELLTGISGALGNLFTDIGGTLGNLFDTSGLKAMIGDAFSSILSGIFGEDSAIVNTASVGIVGTFTELGSQMLEGLQKGINNFISANPTSLVAALFGSASALAYITGSIASFAGSINTAVQQAMKDMDTTPGEVPKAPPAVKASIPDVKPPEETKVDALEMMKAEPTSSSLIADVQNLPTARQLANITRSLPTRRQISEISKRISSLNDIIAEELSSPLSDLAITSEMLKASLGETGDQMRELIANIADIFSNIKNIFTSIQTTNINPKIIEANLATTKQGFETIFTKWTGPEGVQVKINSLKTYFENQQTLNKLENITTIFSQIGTTFNELGTAVSATGAALDIIRNFKGMDRRLETGDSAFAGILRTIQNGYQNYDITGLQAAASSISKISTEVGRIHTSFISLGTHLVDIQESTAVLESNTYSSSFY